MFVFRFESIWAAGLCLFFEAVIVISDRFSDLGLSDRGGVRNRRAPAFLACLFTVSGVATRSKFPTMLDPSGSLSAESGT